GVMTDQGRGLASEAQLLLDFAQHRLVRDFVAFEKAGDQAKEAVGPQLVASEHDFAIMLDDRRDHRRRVVPPDETALRVGARLAWKAALRAGLQRLGATRAVAIDRSHKAVSMFAAW